MDVVHVHLTAWAVDTNSDGTVTVRLHQLTNAAELQRVLARAGVPADVEFSKACGTGGSYEMQAQAVTVTGGQQTLVIKPQAIPRGRKLLVSIIPGTGNSPRIITGTGTGAGNKTAMIRSSLVNQAHPVKCSTIGHARPYRVVPPAG